MTQGYVLPLDDRSATLDAVGGKGASLARLANAGLSVPGGFHVTTGAYRAFVAANNLQPGILAALEGVDPTEPAGLEAASARIRQLFADARVPDDIAAAILSAYADLTNPQVPIPNTQYPVAVRSSATAEDLPGASFAGQQETYLNVIGADAVLEATIRCWASLWTARAIGYRARQGIPSDGVALAVVVQLLVPAEAAGILFTANPVTGRRDQAVISAAWGLGEAVVGGTVTPDSLTVDKATGRVLERQTADKQVMTVQTVPQSAGLRLAQQPAGTYEQPVPEHLRRAPVLSDAAAAELTRLAVQIEALYGMPMDIEWALADGQFAILQARPVTALPAPPVNWETPRPGRWVHGGGTIELVTEPVSPIFETLILPRFDRYLHEWMSRLGLADAMTWPLTRVINGYMYFAAEFRFNPRFIPAWLRNLREHLGAMAQWEPELRGYRARVVELTGAAPETLPSQGLCEQVEALVQAGLRYWSYITQLIQAVYRREAAFVKYYNRSVRRSGDPEPEILLRGQDTRAFAAECSVHDLACASEGVPEVRAAFSSADPIAACRESEPGRRFLASLETHLAQVGHQVYSLDPALPTLADDPRPILLALEAHWQGRESPRTRQARMHAERDAALACMAARLSPQRQRKLSELLSAGQEAGRMREDALFEVGLAWKPTRARLLDLGRRLADVGSLVAVEDVLWLRWDEICSAADDLDAGRAPALLSERAGARRAGHRERESQRPPYILPVGARPSFWWKWMFPTPELQNRDGRDALTGLGVSPGTVTAVARVITSPAQMERLNPGEILVAHTTTPAWTPLFARTAAVVTDLGGALSHSSIVAREYGIPAVTGTGCATERIADGQTITVDGTAGTVSLGARSGATGPGAIEWKRPNPKGQYMRGSVTDLLPDPVSPLFATLAIPSVACVGIKEMLRPLTRSEPDLPSDYILTINDYAYMSATFTPHQWWWILSRMMLSFPRILRQALPLWRDEIRPRYAATVGRWQGQPLERLSAVELWDAIQEVDDAAMLHLASLLVATTGASAGSEMLFTRVYEKMVRRAGDPTAVTYLMGYDSTPIRAEKSLYDLAMWCQAQDDLAAYLKETPSEQLTAQLADDQTPVAGWGEFRERLRVHLRDYGHIIYNLDFARPLPLDDATPMLQTIKMYLAGQGVNPHERQRAAEGKRIQAAEATLKRLRGVRRWAFRKTLGMAQAMAAVRESALSDIGLGYPVLRAMLSELGRRLVEAGGIATSADIFWLEAEEVHQAVDALERDEPVRDMAEDIAKRQATHEALKDVTPPPTLPPRKRYMGINMAEFTPAAAESQIGNVLKGIGAGAGRATAPASVLRGSEDFDRMRPGDVLVATTTTPAWTPLFAMASAVVTDIGGPLSHGSIVAREYGIPAVMGTGVATRRIRSGQTVTVDGGAGTVMLIRDT